MDDCRVVFIVMAGAPVLVSAVPLIIGTMLGCVAPVSLVIFMPVTWTR